MSPVASKTKGEAAAGFDGDDVKFILKMEKRRTVDRLFESYRFALNAGSLPTNTPLLTQSAVSSV
jgi:hypothetical protein